MLTAAWLRRRRGVAGALEIVRALGYPVSRVLVDAAEWKRGGIAIPWADECELALVARLPRFDLFVLRGEPDKTAIKFMTSYRNYNVVTKTALLHVHPCDSRLSVFDLSSRQILRRLDIDLAQPSVHSVDRLNLLAARRSAHAACHIRSGSRSRVADPPVFHPVPRRRARDGRSDRGVVSFRDEGSGGLSRGTPHVASPFPFLHSGEGMVERGAPLPL